MKGHRFSHISFRLDPRPTGWNTT